MIVGSSVNNCGRDRFATLMCDQHASGSLALRSLAHFEPVERLCQNLPSILSRMHATVRTEEDSLWDSSL
jgi:hypothetical protein